MKQKLEPTYKEVYGILKFLKDKTFSIDKKEGLKQK